MPQITASRAVDLPLNVIWPFVAEMDNWAPMLKGYVAHEKSSATKSVWTLTGDLGPFTKTIHVDVTVTEWVDAERVAFSLVGLDENVQATGTLALMEERPELPPRTWWQRLLDFLLRRRVALPQAAESHVVFTFNIEAGGPMGPMINAMLGPYADAVATELLDKVSAHLAGQAKAVK